MRALQSSHLNGMEYDPDARVLTIQFVNGALYSYSGVPPTVADTMSQTSSPGSYFHDKIKGRYAETKLVDGTTRSGRKSTRSTSRFRR